MEREDSGVIDLFALNSRARAATAAGAAAVPRDLFSAPPPAFTTDLCAEPSEHELGSNSYGDDNPFAPDPKAKKKKLMLVGGGAAALLALLVIFASSGSSTPEPTKASAAAAAPAPPPPAATIPAPVVITPPAPAALPAAPTTGATTSSKPPPKAAAKTSAPTKSRATAGGVKLTKVQSAGVAN